MKDAPIIFSGPMVRAILEGRKTQTRRIIKLPKESSLGQWEPWHIGEGLKLRDGSPARPLVCISHSHTGKTIATSQQPGQLLWVRESMTYDFELETWCFVDRAPVHHRGIIKASRLKKLPSIHMPRKASRITLEVEAVKVERLQDISEDDAKAEGVYRVDPTPEEIARGDCTADDFVWMAPGTRQGFGPRKDAEQWGPDPAFAFRCIWESIHGPSSWALNPWVTAITFKPILKNIDTVIGEKIAA